MLVGLPILINLRAAPLIRTSVEQQARQLSAETVNAVALQVLEEMNCEESTFLTVERETNGAIQSITANMQGINRFKAEMNQRMQQALEEVGQRSLKVPIGTLLGGSFLRERGPSVTLRFRVASEVQCDLENSFTSAGINQTKHSVYLTVHTTVYALIPGCRTEVETETEFCIAEQILVGTVPEIFLSKNG